MLRNELTIRLETLINHSFYAADALKLVRLGADANTKDDKGNSLLHRMIKTNSYNISFNIINELVKEYKADINIQDNKGQTPLQCLIDHSFYAADALKLVRLGADANTKDDKGYSLLHRLLTTDSNNISFNVIDELVKEYKADINIKDSKERTPLQYLIEGSFDSEHALTLVRLNADLNVKNSEGKTLTQILVERTSHAKRKTFWEKCSDFIMGRKDSYITDKKVLDELLNKHLKTSQKDNSNIEISGASRANLKNISTSPTFNPALKELYKGSVKDTSPSIYPNISLTPPDSPSQQTMENKYEGSVTTVPTSFKNGR